MGDPDRSLQGSGPGARGGRGRPFASAGPAPFRSPARAADCTLRQYRPLSRPPRQSVGECRGKRLHASQSTPAALRGRPSGRRLTAALRVVRPAHQVGGISDLRIERRILPPYGLGGSYNRINRAGAAQVRDTRPRGCFCLGRVLFMSEEIYHTKSTYVLKSHYTLRLGPDDTT